MGRVGGGEEGKERGREGEQGVGGKREVTTIAKVTDKNAKHHLTKSLTQVCRCCCHGDTDGS